MIKRLFLVILLLLLIFGGIFALKMYQGGKMAEMMSAPQPAPTVASVEVSELPWQPTMNAIGTLVADQGIDLTSEVAGIVSAIHFRSGEQVTEGTELLNLDDSIDRAALAALIAERRLAEVEFQRVENLLPKKAVSQADFDAAKARYEAARARVSEQQAIIARKVVRAPFGGYLGIRRVDLGQYLEAGEAITTLATLDPIHVDYSLPERQLSRVAVGQTVEIEVAARPDQVFRGRISSVEPGIAAGSRSIQLRATLKNPQGLLRPGMFAQVRTLDGGPRRVLTLPQTALSFNTYGDFVFVLSAAGDGSLTAARRQVETGEVRDGRVVIRSGLKAGEQVVRAGLVKLRDGMTVQIDNSVVLDDASISQP